MKQEEADIIAKMVRNLDCELWQREEFINSVCKELYNRDQFFNVKRFKTIASQELGKNFYGLYGPKNGD